jgi:hypothetical protein
MTYHKPGVLDLAASRLPNVTQTQPMMSKQQGRISSPVCVRVNLDLDMQIPKKNESELALSKDAFVAK